MPVTVRIPQPLRALTSGQATVSANGATLRDCLDGLEAAYPGIRERILDGAGEIRRFVNVYVNGDDVRFLRGLDTPLADGDEVSIVPAVAGG